MEILTGSSISKETCIGRIMLYSKQRITVEKLRIEDTAAEVKRFHMASAAASERLAELYEKTLQRLGKSAAAIFQAHKMMLEDETWQAFVLDSIRINHFNAEYAVSKAGEHFAGILSSMEDKYMQARAEDIRDITERMIYVLSQVESDRPVKVEMTDPVIVVADELSPSEAASLDKERLAGFVTKHGSSVSHTAILARTYGIPAISGIDPDKAWDGKPAAIDGETGTLYIDPTQEILQFIKEKKAKNEQKQKRLMSRFKDKETVTKDGKRIGLFANIGHIRDAENALLYGAEGIGLFRSEFLYLDKNELPTEEEQYEVYKQLAELMGERELVIRTLDIGADKTAGYFNLPKEDNPAMGLRGIRFSLSRPDVFKSQLRALYRASAYGNISILLPMISSLEEVKQAKKIMKEVRSQLKAENIPIRKKVKLGLMIETPAAALISDLLIKECDFFSIGSNDLTQYLIAADRGNQNLAHVFDPHHEAVKRMLSLIIENAHSGGKRVGICGELGSDTRFTGELILMGIDAISVSPAMVLPMRKKIRETDSGTNRIPIPS